MAKHDLSDISEKPVGSLHQGYALFVYEQPPSFCLFEHLFFKRRQAELVEGTLEVARYVEVIVQIRDFADARLSEGCIRYVRRQPVLEPVLISNTESLLHVEQLLPVLPTHGGMEKLTICHDPELYQSTVLRATTYPPSTRRMLPVMYSASSLARKATALPISRGVPMRPQGRSFPFSRSSSSV